MRSPRCSTEGAKGRHQRSTRATASWDAARRTGRAPRLAEHDARRPSRPPPRRADPLGRVTVVGLGPAGPELVTARSAAPRSTGSRVRRPAHRRATRRRRLLSGAPSFDDVYDAADTARRGLRARSSRGSWPRPTTTARSCTPCPARRSWPSARSSCSATPPRPARRADGRARAVVPRPGVAGPRRRSARRRRAAGRRAPLRGRGGRRARAAAGRPVRPARACCPTSSWPSTTGPTVVVLQRLGLPDADRRGGVGRPRPRRRPRPPHDALDPRAGRRRSAAELVRFHELVRTPARPSARGTASRPTPASPGTCSRRPTRCSRPSSASTSTPATGFDAPRGGARRPALPGRVPRRPRRARRVSSRWPTWRAGIHDKLVAPPPARVRRRRGRQRRRRRRRNWEQLKKAEKGRASLMDGIPTRPARPCPTRRRCRRRRPSVGFDWDDVHGALPKIGRGAGRADRRARRAGERRDELGDLLFAVVNVARHLGIDAEAALRPPPASSGAASRRSSGSPPPGAWSFDRARPRRPRRAVGRGQVQRGAAPSRR